MVHSFGRTYLALMLGGAIISLSSGSGWAQAVVGPAEKPAVEVDLGVIDRLGAAPTLPDMYLNRHPSAAGGAAQSGGIILRRPSPRASEVRPAKPQTPTIIKPAKPPKGGSQPTGTIPVKPPKPTAPSVVKPAPTVKPQPQPAPTVKPTQQPAATIKPTPEPKPEKIDGIPPKPPIEPPSVVEPGSVEPAKPVEPTIPVESEPQSSPRQGASLTPGALVPPEDHSWGGVGVPIRSPNISGASPETVAPERPEPQAGQQPGPTSLTPPAEKAVAKPVEPPKEPPPLPTQSIPAVEGKASISFIKDSADISSESEAVLGGVAQKMARQPDLTILLQAFASASGESASRARHMSLSRALAVRSKLIESGVRSTRIEVRALGDKVEGGGDPERVDLILQKRDKN